MGWVALGSKGLGRFETEEFSDLVTGADELDQDGGGPLPDLGVPLGHGFKKVGQFAEAVHGVGVHLGVFCGVQEAIAQYGEGGVELALFAFVEDDAKHFPDIAHGFKVIAFVAHDVDEPDNAPVLKFFEAGADVGTGNVEGCGDVLRVEGFWGDEKQGVNLGHGAVDAPAGAHFTPMEDELFLDCV